MNNGWCKDNATSAAVTPAPWYPGVEYPGSGCTQCHVDGAFDYSANEAAVPSLMWPTAANGTPAASISTSPYVTLGTVYGSGTGTGTLVSSPIASVCFSCHDSVSARAHIEASGGKIYYTRTATPLNSVNTEACLDCHGAGGLASIANAHK